MFYARLPTDEELAGSGFSREDYEEEAEVWPENWPAFDLFAKMDTQWDVCAGASAVRVGLKYLVLFELMDRRGLIGAEWESMFDDLRAMEQVALESANAR